MIKKLIKIFSVYILVSLAISIVFFIAYTVTGDSASIWNVFLYSVAKTINCNAKEIISPNALTVIHQFVAQILFVVLTGYTVSAIYNHNKKDIVLADKMIIRKRTSPGVENDITISIMAENKSKYVFYNARCEMTCLYYKSENLYETNKDTYSFKASPDIINFYRYSFDLNELPVKVWETLIKKEGLNYNESVIEVRLTGKLDNFDTEISVRKTYKMSDIVIAKGNESIINKARRRDNSVKKSKPKWENINKIIDYSEFERKEIVEGIMEHINKNSKEMLV